MTDSTIIAGGPGEFMTVRHLVARGDQVTIGRTLAEEAGERGGWAPYSIDPIVQRARWAWFARNWPQQHARMLGMAAVFGIDPATDARCVDGLDALPAGSGCSAVWCPPWSTSAGHGLLGRNYDFFTMSAAQLAAGLAGGQAPSAGEPPMASRPYVITTIPDEGLASTVVTMSALDGCTEGVNEAGLTAALLLADVENAEAPDETARPQVGLDAPQVVRFLLDTCTNAEQAKQALLGAKQYGQGAGCHYIVGDAAGAGFVYERGAGDTEHFVDLAEAPLCVTNHLLHVHPDVDALPADTENSFRTYERARTLTKRTGGETLTAQGIRDAMDEVSVPADAGSPWRTLWRSIADVDARTLSVRFYLGDCHDGPTARYSDELTFGVPR